MATAKCRRPLQKSRNAAARNRPPIVSLDQELEGYHGRSSGVSDSRERQTQ
jgi:hypothetical protein